jgi:hypothetical protein
MLSIKNKKVFHLTVAGFMAVSSLCALGLAPRAHAAALTQVMVRFDHMKQSTATNGMVCAKPASTATEAKVKVTFPTNFTVAAASNWTIDVGTTSTWPAGASAWPSINTATLVSGQDVTFPSGDLTPGTLYCFNWYNATPAALTTPSSPATSEVGSVTTQTSVPADIDTAQFATATISNDEILVTATVPPVFTFALSANSDALGTLSSGSVKNGTPFTATVGTNAKNGYAVWAKSAAANGGLTSASASYTIASTCNGGTQVGTNSTLSAGTEGYNTGVTSSHAAGSGTITVNSVFNGSSTSRGGGLCGTYQSVATSTGTASADVLTLTNNVAISAATAAATDFTDTITVVGAGLF